MIGKHPLEDPLNSRMAVVVGMRMVVIETERGVVSIVIVRETGNGNEIGNGEDQEVLGGEGGINGINRVVAFSQFGSIF